MNWKGEEETSIDPGPFVVQPSGQSTRIRHLSAATGLIITYFIEIGVQIFLTVQFCHAVVSLAWFWTVALSVLLCSVVVSTVSLIWVCHSLDFAGRLCGRLLCYVMHVFLLGIPWRYLKLAFAYDPTDVQEFIALRIFQTYVQSLPLSAIHLAALLTFRPQKWTSLGVWLVGVESVSIVIALAIASYLTPLTSPNFKSNPGSSSEVNRSKTTRCFQENLKCSTSTSSSSDESVMWCRILKIELNLLSRALLLLCRIVTLALLWYMAQFWIGILVIGVHLIVAFTWIHVTSRRNESWTISKSLECSYVTFWDISSTLCGELRLVTWTGPLVLLLVESCLILSSAQKYFGESTGWFVSVTGGSEVVGFILFTSLNLVKLLSPKRTFFGTRVQKMNVPCSDTQSSSGKEGEVSLTTGLKKNNLKENQSQVITGNKYENVCEKMDLTSDKRSRTKVMLTKILNPGSDSYQNLPPPNLYSSVLIDSETNLGQSETFVPDTCCNDSNGSSNSRNTNTILDIPAQSDEPDEQNPEETDFVFCFQPPSNSSRIPKEPKHQKLPEIKTASRVIMKKHLEKLRCPCQSDLIEEGSYGILFCEERKSNEKITCQRSQNRLRVLCAKCLQNHDPLLTTCQEEDIDKLKDDKLIPTRRLPSITLLSETTDYPSETEMTWTIIDEEGAWSEVTSLHSTSSAPEQPMWATMMVSEQFPLTKEFTSKEYVKTWLLSSQTLERHYRHQLQKERKDKHVGKYGSLQYHPYHRPGRKVTNMMSPNVLKISAVTTTANQVGYKDLEIIV